MTREEGQQECGPKHTKFEFFFPLSIHVNILILLQVINICNNDCQIDSSCAYTFSVFPLNN